MPSIQEIIHKFEVGEGSRFISKLALLLAFIALVLTYNVREYRNFMTIEAMEAAQLARNLAEGEGFTTQSIRPLSLAMVGAQQGQEIEDPMVIKGKHPDLITPPVYPVLLSLWMKVMPFEFDIPSMRSENFRRYQPEVMIGFLNQILFFASGLLVFLISKRLFDGSVAWMTTAVFFGSDVLWRFSVSGLSTMLSMFLFLALVSCLVAMERASRAESDESEPDHTDGDADEEDGPHQPKPRSFGWFLGMAAVGGLVLGVGALTRYSFLWLFVPSLLFTALFLKSKRVPVSLIMLITALVVSGPWLMRNYNTGGTLFGIHSYDIVMDTDDFPGDRLERALSADISMPDFSVLLRKLLVNAPTIVTEQLPTLGGSWMAMFFFVGLMIPFSNPGLRHLRIFSVLSLLIMILVQALGRTHVSDLSPLINGQNHLVMVTPLVLMFGVALFFTLLDQLPLPYEGARTMVVVGVFLVVCSPLVFRLLPPRTTPIAYPPYSPPLIQQLSQWNDPDELMMSDMPWAVAWYGDRKCLWLTRNVEPDFYTINDEHEKIHSIYLTPLTTDRRLMSEVLKGADHTWARFYMDVQVRQNLPKGFPLKFGYPHVMPDQLYVSDRQRWLSVFQEVIEEQQ